MQRQVGLGLSTELPDFDFETYSEAGYFWDSEKQKWRTPDNFPKGKPGLGSVGAAVYSEHPSTRVVSLAYDLKDGIGERLWVPGAPPPVDLFDHIARGGLLEAFNSMFEYLIWLNVCVVRMGWPPLRLEQLRCAMAKGRAWSLPGALGKVATVLNAPIQKDKKGTAIIKKLSVPQNPLKRHKTAGIPGVRLRYAALATPETHPELYADFYRYNIDDIKAEASVSAMIPDLIPEELELWGLDQRVNARGVHIDREALDACVSIVKQTHVKYTAELQAITGGTVNTVSELQKMLAWLAGRGVHMGSLDAEHVAAALADDKIPQGDPCRRVLEIRSVLGSASVKKVFAIDRMTSEDDRLRGLFAFCGADRTGRFAGRGPQPQNIPGSGPPIVECQCGRIFWSGLMTCPQCRASAADYAEPIGWGPGGVEAALCDILTRDLARVEEMWGDALAAIAGCLRGLFSAAPGHDLLCSDYSAIEAVVIAELAGEKWRQDVFRDHGKIYEMSASMATGVPFAEIMQHKKDTGNHHPLRKTIGKVRELAGGYQGAVGAWIQFGADKFMTEDEILADVKKWRAESPAIVAFWRGLEKAAILAVQNPGQCFGYRSITYGVKDDILYCKLPSGRSLTYHSPIVIPGVSPWGKPTLDLSYMGYNSDYKKGPLGWMRLDTYGGKLAENVTQAVARDILAHAMLSLDRAGYNIVLHVHDEIVAEVLAGHGSVEEFERIMAEMPEWCKHWPIKAAGGWRGRRYRK